MMASAKDAVRRTKPELQEVFQFGSEKGMAERQGCFFRPKKPAENNAFTA